MHFMQNWPPNPDNAPPKTDPNKTTYIPPKSDEDARWRTIENVLLATTREQTKARKWQVFFRILSFVWLFLLLALLFRACSFEGQGGAPVLPTEEHLAVIDIDGVIGTSTGQISADGLIEVLEEAFENPNVKAIILNINSPGGSPVQSDRIYQALASLRASDPDKKVYATIGDIGASGAYYIAVGADEILANPSSIVGSIGVILPSYNVEGLLDKIGVSDQTLTAGAHKNILSPTRASTQEEIEHIQSMLATTHGHFIQAVIDGRGERLQDPQGNGIFTGLFWAGSDALALGLVDRTGDHFTLEQELGYPLINYTPKDPLSLFFDRLGVSVGRGMGQQVTEHLAFGLVEQDKTPSLS